jgi:hypothetical protein
LPALLAGAGCGSPRGVADGGADDGPKATLTSSPIPSTVPVSPFVQADDAFFYFYGQLATPVGDIYRLSRAGGTAEVLVVGLPDDRPGPLRVRDGRLAYLSGGAIHVRDLATGADTTPVNDDAGNVPGAPARVDDLALGADGLYWVSRRADPAAVDGPWIQRRLWTAASSEVLYTGNQAFTFGLTPSTGQTFGIALIAFATGSVRVLNAGAAQPAALAVVPMPSLPLDGVALDDGFAYVASLDGKTIERIPRTGGATVPLVSDVDNADGDLIVYGRYVLWTDFGGLHAVAATGGHSIPLGQPGCFPFLVGRSLFCVQNLGELAELTITGLDAWPP